MFSERSVIWRRMFMAGLGLGLLGLFHRQMIVPCQVRAAELVRQRAELRERLDSASELIRGAKNSDQTVAEARARLNQLTGTKAQDADMASFAEDIKRHFSPFGLSASIVRLVKTEDDPELPGYQRVYWSLGLPVPPADPTAGALLLGVAKLEEQGRYTKVIDFALQPDAKDPSLRMASVSIVVLDRK